MKKATTIRLQEDVQHALDELSVIERRPKNKMVNEAVAEYVARKSTELRRSTSSILARVETYCRADPDFEAAIDAFAEAEATEGRHDPAEGRHDPAEGLPTDQSAGSLTRDIRALLDA